MESIPVLDHGYVKFVEAWGVGDAGKRYEIEPEYDDDYEVGIIEAARQSTRGSFRGWEGDGTKENPGDRRLLKFLYENGHASPFEFAGMVVEVQAPIFVFREWHRHRTQSYNEMSARYTPLPDLYYLPESQVVMDRGYKASANKQSDGIREFDDLAVDPWLKKVSEFYKQSEELYRSGLAAGIPKELARIVNPVGHYSRMRASANLRNWLAFMTLRSAPNAQWEIRQFSLALGQVVAQKFPQTSRLFGAA